MVSNLIFYGSNLGLGFLFSLYFLDREERSKGLTIAAILTPLLWTLILSAGKGTTDLIKLYDYEQMNYGSSRNRALFWAMPMFCSFFAFGCLWIEICRIKNKK